MSIINTTRHTLASDQTQVYFFDADGTPGVATVAPVVESTLHDTGERTTSQVAWRMTSANNGQAAEALAGEVIDIAATLRNAGFTPVSRAEHDAAKENAMSEMVERIGKRREARAEALNNQNDDDAAVLVKAFAKSPEVAAVLMRRLGIEPPKETTDVVKK